MMNQADRVHFGIMDASKLPNDVLVLKTRESLYPPVNIEVDGELYQSRKLTRELSIELEALDKKITSGDDIACYKSVEILFGIDEKVLLKLDKREVRDILLHAKRKFQEEETEKLKDELKQLQKRMDINPDPKQKIPSKKRSGGKR